MRPVGIQWVFFVYAFSLGAYMVDIILLAPLGMQVSPILAESPDNNNIVGFVQINAPEISSVGTATLNPTVNGTVIDRVTQSVTAGLQGVWVLMSLLSGTYMFGFLALLGIDPIFILIIQMIFGVVVASTIIYYIQGRGK